ncbi:hypothetical protein [Moraxella nasicaprae]|uniref:Uncharacterized protein n=1 Tax=Moraxella nasicaprae TaxID=2904122 RepID=A0ABY6F6C9_9GAMM|nr:hypothetical protein [Moraxella nasicaprae]UXZ05651.1 hypothetical protein LU297_04205 [Moraxella nasicaprae]
MFKKKLLVLTIGLSCVVANATPNSWSYGHNFGQAQFYIENKKSQSLEISCGEEYGRSIYFSYNIDDEPIDVTEKNQFSFLFDNTIPVTITTTKESDNEWVKFNEAISKAKKIQVFRNNQEVAVFTPLPHTVKTEISHIKDECRK